MTKINDPKYADKIDSVSLAKIDGMFFTVIDAERSDYTQYNDDGTSTINKGVQLTTKESFTVDGKQENKFHTTRVNVVKEFTKELVVADAKIGALEPVICVKENYVDKKDGKQKYNFNLVDKEEYLSNNGSSGTQGVLE